MRIASTIGARLKRRAAMARTAARPPSSRRLSPPVRGSVGAPVVVPGAPVVVPGAPARAKSEADSTWAIWTFAGDARALEARFRLLASVVIRPLTAGTGTLAAPRTWATLSPARTPETMAARFAGGVIVAVAPVMPARLR